MKEDKDCQKTFETQLYGISYIKYAYASLDFAYSMLKYEG